MTNTVNNSNHGGSSTPQRRSSTLLHLWAPWRLVMIAIAVTALVPLLLHMKVPYGQSSPRHLSAMELAPSVRQASQNRVAKPCSSSQWDDFIQLAEDGEQSIRDFFHGEPRALLDGIPFGGKELHVLSQRLADRISLCAERATESQSDDDRKKHCSLRVVFAGGAQVSGRDVFKNQTYPYQVEPRLRALAEAAGLELEVLNNAMDSDLSREGPQTSHMCMENFVGKNVDVVGWDFESMMQGSPAAQIEAYVRWAAALRPALILFNRGGPHTRSRRGKPRPIVNLVGNHDATIFEDVDIPEQRQDNDAYRDSEKFQELWANKRNSFWEPVMDKYSSFLDFAAIDPAGSIWHLDHLEDFSNTAFDDGKALPLYDCPAPEHPPPCDQVPKYIMRHLERENKTLADLPRDDTSGAFCGVQTGCRHHWYGGPRSHAVRAALNALPIIRAFHAAAKLLKTRDCHDTQSSHDEQFNTNSKDFSMGSLPSPDHCSKFCDMVPTCLSTYVPNIGRQLGPAILPNETSPVSMPRLGACLYGNDPEFQKRNLDKRFGPLGWNDRKYAFRLAKEDPNKKPKKKEPKGPLDASRTAIAFNTTGPGPLVLCEPPCFLDDCSPKRMRPLVKHVTLELNGKLLRAPKGPPVETEVGGMFCRVIAISVPAGNHLLRMSTEVVEPEHVMFSHIISFA